MCSDRCGDKSFENRFRRAGIEHWKVRERVQGILGPPEAHREARRFHDDESQVSTKFKIANQTRNRFHWKFLIPQELCANFVARSFHAEFSKIRGMFDKTRDRPFSAMKLATFQMAPPLITESVFLPSILLLPARPL